MKQAKFFRKASNIEELKSWTRKQIGAQPIIKIKKIIELPAAEYEKFTSALLEDFDFIAENKNLMGVDLKKNWHCILVKTKNKQAGILTQADGYNYSRYSAYIENID